jgi:hypothetical protein
MRLPKGVSRRGDTYRAQVSKGTPPHRVVERRSFPINTPIALIKTWQAHTRLRLESVPPSARRVSIRLPVSVLRRIDDRARRLGLAREDLIARQVVAAFTKRDGFNASAVIDDASENHQ